MDARILVMFVCSVSLAAAQGEARRTLKECVADLGSDDPLTRDRAMEDLIEYGPPSLGLLRNAAQSDDPEVARRAAFATAAIGFREKIPFSHRFLLSYPDVYGDLARGKDPLVLLQEMANGSTADKEIFLAPVSNDIERIAVYLISERYDALSSQAKGIILGTFGNHSIRLSPVTAGPFLKDEDATIRRRIISHTNGSDGDLLPLLNDPDPEVRATAIRKIGKSVLHRSPGLINDDHLDVQCAILEVLGEAAKEHLPLILKYLNDPRATVRRTAIGVLQRSGLSEGADAIAPHIRDPDRSVRSDAIEALSRMGALAHLEAIVGMLGDERDDVRPLAGLAANRMIRAEGFSRYERKREVVARLQSLLARDDPSIQVVALNLLRQQPAEVDRAVVAPFMFDENNDVREEAVGLVKAIDPGWFLERAGWLLEDRNERIAGVVIDAIAERQSAAMIGDLLKLLGETRSDNLCHRIVRTVIDVPEAEAADDLILLLRAKNSPMLSEATQRLSESSDPNIRRQIGALLKHPDDDVRYIAVQILNGRDMREYAGTLFSMLESDNALLRQATVVAIAGFDDRESTRDLLPLLRDSDARVRASTARALMRVDAETFAEIVAPLLKDRDALVRAEAADLIRSGSRHHREVAPLLRDPDRRVRMTALKSFRHESAREHIEEIARFLDDESDEFRREAIIALRFVEAKTILPRITPLLRDESENVRNETLDLLVRWDARECIDLLYPLIQDQSAGIRSKACELIERWDAPGKAMAARGRR